MHSKEVEYFAKQDLHFEKIIAKGGYGTIFYVYNKQYCNHFALKKIPKELFNQSEIDCLLRLDDARIVSLYKYYHFHDHVYMLMEYCPSDLQKIIKQKTKVDREEYIKIVYDTIAAVKACHDRNIAHSDIKPSNFMIDQYGRVKIGDFGLSAIYSQHPTSGDFKGTRLFMAPEIFHYEKYNPMVADIWALGVTLYYFATEKYPFFCQDVDGLIHRIKSGQFNELLVRDEQLRDIIKRCLDPNPRNRPTCAQLLDMPFFKTEPQGEELKENVKLNRLDVFTRSQNLIVKPKINKPKNPLMIQAGRIYKNASTLRLQMIIPPPPPDSI
ncbi:CAMK family protein kinase [Trichomonas vaginalis G3]|uniref:CAMK family protein kinase n=1 Tax=Trichomonas vaginalis (strain ATCC PRA-98 / G3) TaxID=412133 RepID=A2DQY4_TRIV3|nr:protein serine/threonine kinase protein [Trichomonas vaginalis G3]EAY17251.1 CAMK family protein kinase [Trichomonas vaginalis G3]KAI5486217.1 protein serine/threonine kinase protein [Trichomonas vaginalis G3]|eukprot:XP_001329474.1 CAMK family protein kinase [Trichomonas vaginalis G3]